MENCFGITILTAEQIKALQTSKSIEQLLASKRLRDDILSITSQSSDSNRLNRLRKLRAAKPEFEEFLGAILHEIQPTSISNIGVGDRVDATQSQKI